MPYGNVNCEAWGNRFFDLVGRTAQANSGVGIMVLDSTGISAWNNLFDGCAVGLFYGNRVGQSTGQSSVIDNNTFIDIRRSALHVHAEADTAQNLVRNNIFQALSDEATWLVGNLLSDMRFNCFHNFAAQPIPTTCITDDPLLGNEGRPASASPALGKGRFFSPVNA